MGIWRFGDLGIGRMGIERMGIWGFGDRKSGDLGIWGFGDITSKLLNPQPGQARTKKVKIGFNFTLL